MSSIQRRFGAEGIRRGLRQSIDGGSGGAAPVVTLDDLWAEWGGDALWWWQGGVGLTAGVAGTWTDRVGAVNLAAFGGASMASATLSGVSAVRIQVPDDDYTEATVGPPVAHRMFALLACADTTGAASCDVLTWTDYAGVDVRINARDIGGEGLSKALSGATSEKTGTAWDDGSARVIRREYVATHASHLLRIDGSAQGDGDDTGDAALSGEPAGYVTSYADGIALDFTAALICALPYAAMTDPQAAQFETDLLTIVGL